MGLESLFEPKCSIPLYLQPNVDIAQKCGEIDGIILCVVVSLFVIILGYVSYNNVIPVNRATDEEKIANEQKQYFVLSVCGAILFIIWIIIPALFGFYSRRVWLGQDFQVQELMKSGFTRQEAIEQTQALYQPNLQADAIKKLSTSVRSGIQIVVPL